MIYIFYDNSLIILLTLGWLFLIHAYLLYRISLRVSRVYFRTFEVLKCTQIG